MKHMKAKVGHLFLDFLTSYFFVSFVLIRRVTCLARPRGKPLSPSTPALQSFADVGRRTSKVIVSTPTEQYIRGDFVSAAIDAATLCGIDLTTKHQPTLTSMALSD